jgi:cyclophilin family peptidyl-prolyl cis-trans isomerase
MKNRFRSRRRHATLQAVQKLEPRRLLTISALDPSSAVVMNTSLGEIVVQLYTDGTEPATIANFLSYVSAGTYNGTVFHRVTYNGDSNSDTFGIVQGGGFTDSSGTLTPVTTNAPIVNEATTAHPNSIGTIAMARTSGQNSATSQFFFNTTDNSTVFDNNSADSTYNPYAAFGNVIRGLGIVDTIDNLSTSNSVTSSDGETLNPPETNTGAFVTINTATEEDSLTVTIGKNDAAGDHAVSFRDPSTQTGTTISLSTGTASVIFTGTNISAHSSNGTVMVTGTDLQCQQISTTNTTASSNLTFTSPGRTKHVNIGDISITGSMNSISGSGVNLTGDISATGSVKSIKLLSSSAAGTIDIDTNQVPKAPATTINIPFLSDISISSGGSITELITRQYTVDDGTTRGISAAGNISIVKDYGALEASVSAGSSDSSGNPIGGNIHSVTASQISGSIEGATIGSVTTDEFQEGTIYSSAAFSAKTFGINSVNIKGALDSGQIIATGSIGSIKAASMTGTVVQAGYDSSGTAADSFQYPVGTTGIIKSLSLKTPKGATNTSFSDSQIVAPEIDSLNLGRVATSITSGSSIALMGIQTRDLISLTATTDQKQSLDLSNVTSQTALNAIIAKRGLKLGPAAAVGTVGTGTTTTSGFISGDSYSAITLSTALATAIPANTVVTIVSGSNTQTATLSAAANIGDTSLTVTPFTANANYAAGLLVQGTQATFTTLTSGSTYSSITLNGPLATAIPSGTVVTLDAGSGTTQAVTLSADANVGDTSLTVTPFAANAAYTTTATVDGTQVFATTSGLTANASYDTLTLSSALATSLTAGTSLTITSSTDSTTTQTVTLAANANIDDTSLTVTTFTATAAFASGSTITDTTGDTIPTLSGGTETTASTGTFASAVGTATLATSIAATSPGLTSGSAYTSIALSAPLTAALTSGEILTLSSGNNSQIISLSAAGAVGDASLTTTSFTANANYPAGSTLKVAGFVFDILPAASS